jgi:TetR/AcrR family transcriptional repressor of nem operon
LIEKSKSKRLRLVDAANRLFRTGGYCQISIAEVAKEADVPLGNVFYYFPKKEDMLQAVADVFFEQLSSATESVELITDPIDRIVAFLKVTQEFAFDRKTFGCPVMRLYQQGGGEHLDQSFFAILDEPTQWMAKQFRLAGLERDEAQQAAKSCTARVQGAYLLGFAYNDEALINSLIDECTHDIRHRYSS